MKFQALVLWVCLVGMSAQPTLARAEAPVLRFAIMSDIHVQTKDQISQQKFKRALADLHQVLPKADALIINGDLTNGQPADYELLKRMIRNHPHPQNIFYTIGNHDFHKAWFDKRGKRQEAAFPNGETEQASIQRFLVFAGQRNVYYDTWLNGYHFLFLGSEQYRQSNPKNHEDAYLSSEQLEWLSQHLKEGNPKQPTFVFLHQPLPNTVSGTNGWGNNRAVIQHDELKRILSKHPEVFFFSGHTHWQLHLPTTLAQEGCTMVNSSSVWEPWDDTNKPISEQRSEGLYVEVYPDHVLIKGRDFSKKSWIQGAQYAVPFIVK